MRTLTSTQRFLLEQKRIIELAELRIEERKRRTTQVHQSVLCPLDGRPMKSPLRDYATCKHCKTKWTITRHKDGSLSYLVTEPKTFKRQQEEQIDARTQSYALPEWEPWTVLARGPSSTRVLVRGRDWRRA